MIADSGKKQGFLRVAFHAGQTGGSGWEQVAWLVWGRFGIHSKFSALVANTRLLTPKGCQRRACGDPQGSVGSWTWVVACLCPLHRDPRPTCKESQTPCFPWPVDTAMSVTLLVSTHKIRMLRAASPAPQACKGTPCTGWHVAPPGSTGKQHLLRLAGGGSGCG